MLAVNHIDKVNLAIVGVGKIARDQHIPSIAKNPAFNLAAVVRRTLRQDSSAGNWILTVFTILNFSLNKM
jgi:hypothetical protein